jgi:hypothetical protein
MADQPQTYISMQAGHTTHCVKEMSSESWNSILHNWKRYILSTNLFLMAYRKTLPSYLPKEPRSSKCCKPRWTSMKALMSSLRINWKKQ